MLKRILHQHAFPGVDRSRKTIASLLAGLVLSTAPAFAWQQSPMLDKHVQGGKLPPVEKRLPENPLVVEPVESVGKYGGTWHSGLRGGGDDAWIARTVAYDGLVRYDREWRKVIPNLAESWEINDDATEYTFRLRRGLKWSDGRPFSSQDVAFAVELMQDPNYPADQNWTNDAQNPVRVEVVDDVTFKFVFPRPHGLLLDELASVNGLTVVSLSKEYCSQFHPKYNPGADELARKSNYQNWSFMMVDKCAWQTETQRWGNVDLPFMNAWTVKEPLRGDSTRVVFERNPYYWKVDPDGNQLPYIDRLEMRVSESVEELTLLALNGKIDFTDRHITNITNKPVLFDGQQASGYRLGENIPSNSNTMVIQLNLNHTDTVKRELFQNKDFRIGFSHAIDRKEIIDVVFTGQGEPFQPAPRPELPFYDEKMAKQYTEFDPELAAKHLAAAGLTERNADGILLMPDGRPLAITIDTIAAFRPEWIDILELMQLQLRQVGIEVRINNIDRTLFYEKRPGNDYDAQVWQGDGGLDVIQEPRYYFPSGQEFVWAFKWQAWFKGTTPEIAQEPVDWARKQMELYKQIQSEGNEERRNELMRQILAIAKEQFPVIGISLPPNGYYVAKNNLRNVPPVMKHAWLFPTPAPYDPQQWYFDQ